MGSIGGDEDLNRPLLQESKGVVVDPEKEKLASRVWIESKKLWHIVGPSIFSRVASYSMNVVTQAFAGHLGELELASISIANTVIVGFNFGLLVPAPTPLSLSMCIYNVTYLDWFLLI